MRQIVSSLTLLFVAIVVPAGITPSWAQNLYCQGSSSCLRIYNVHYGTRCGSGDSVEADYANDSGSQYLRGYVVFNTPRGKVYSPTDLLKPGEKKEGGIAYVCHGSGVPTSMANTGSDPAHLRYPRHD